MARILRKYLFHIPSIKKLTKNLFFLFFIFFIVFSKVNWIKGNEVYQLFRSCLHYSTKGKRVQIIVALSTTKFYCFNPIVKNSLIPKEVSGSCLISELTSITTYSNSSALVKIVGPSTILNGGRGKVPISFMLRFFSSEDSTWLFVFFIFYVFLMLNFFVLLFQYE